MFSLFSNWVKWRIGVFSRELLKISFHPLYCFINYCMLIYFMVYIDMCFEEYIQMSDRQLINNLKDPSLSCL